MDILFNREITLSSIIFHTEFLTLASKQGHFQSALGDLHFVLKLV